MPSRLQGQPDGARGLLQGCGRGVSGDGRGVQGRVRGVHRRVQGRVVRSPGTRTGVRARSAGARPSALAVAFFGGTCIRQPVRPWENYFAMVLLGLAPGIATGGLPAYAKEVSTAALVLAMTFSLTEVRFRGMSFRADVGSVARALTWIATIVERLAQVHRFL